MFIRACCQEPALSSIKLCNWDQLGTYPYRTPDYRSSADWKQVFCDPGLFAKRL